MPYKAARERQKKLERIFKEKKKQIERGENLDVYSVSPDPALRAAVAEQGYRPEYFMRDTEWEVRKAARRHDEAVPAYKIPIEEMGFSEMLTERLKRNYVEYAGDLAAMSKEDVMMRFTGRPKVEEVTAKLAELGLSLYDEAERAKYKQKAVASIETQEESQRKPSLEEMMESAHRRSLAQNMTQSRKIDIER